MPLRTGKKPATSSPHDLLAERFVKAAALPSPPAQFGHEHARRRTGWGMLGNDEWGDCAWAGPAHETVLWVVESGGHAHFTTRAVLSDYSAGTGFDESAGPPGSNPTDRGSNVRDVASYRRRTGIVDAHDSRHKIGAYLKLDHSDPDVLAQAAFVFGVVGLGLAFPSSAMQQFDAGEPWDVVRGEPDPQDGHYVPYVARRALPECVTWGQVQPMTPAFLAKYVDEAWVYVSPESLNGQGQTPEGLDVAALNAALGEIDG